MLSIFKNLFCSQNTFHFLRVMNVVKTPIGIADFLLVFFSGKSLKILMHLGKMHFLSSIEIRLLKVT